MDTQQVIEAVEAWAEVWASDELTSEVAARLTCMEAESVATLLRTIGREVAATTFLAAHAEDDDSGDGHYPRTVLYTKPGCVQCTATYRAMDDAGIEYDVVDVAEDDEALARIKALGYMAAPVVIAAGGRDHWSGFRPDKIATLQAR